MKQYHLSRRSIIHSVTGVIYEMAPGFMPRNIDAIVKYIKTWCDENIGNKYLIRVEAENIYKTFHDMLFNCEEFTQLNISQKLWDSGVRNYKDKRNGGFLAVAVEHNEAGNPIRILTPAEYIDFIDLDACVRGIVNELITTEENNEDCFLCKNAKTYPSTIPGDGEICKMCTLNPANKCNYEVHPQALIPNSKKHGTD